jgi:UPF0716 protein FxsA
LIVVVGIRVLVSEPVTDTGQMTGVLAALAVIIPIAELVVFALVADMIGLGTTILLLIGISVLGAVLLAHQGVGTWRRLRETIRRRESPTDDLVDAGLIMVAALLLLTPGFFTDALAFLVVIPPTRRFLRATLRRIVGVIAARRFGWKTSTAAVAGKKIYDVQATKRTTPGSGRPERPGQLPSEGHPSAEDDSPDTA